MSRRNRNLFIAIILSLLFHVGVIYMIDFFDWLDIQIENITEDIPDEITVIFPENRPQMDKQMSIVDNQNETDEIPEDANLLSDKNSRARNEILTDQQKLNTPSNQGFTDFQDLSAPMAQKNLFRAGSKPFSKESLTGRQLQKIPEFQSEKDGEEAAEQQTSDGYNQQFDQKKFSTLDMGAITLSTYAWEFTPYIREFKKKLRRVWTAPPAYGLGWIHGNTVIHFEISRDGKLLNYKVLGHNGHESLETASVGAIKAVFPFLKLPDNFPDETLTITFNLVYPKLKKVL